jgi:hypothetical protein
MTSHHVPLVLFDSRRRPGTPVHYRRRCAFRCRLAGAAITRDAWQVESCPKAAASTGYRRIKGELTFGQSELPNLVVRRVGAIYVQKDIAICFN